MRAGWRPGYGLETGLESGFDVGLTACGARFVRYIPTRKIQSEQELQDILVVL